MESQGRISRLLRDARAAVKDAERPETPADLSRTLMSRNASSRPLFRRLSAAGAASLGSDRCSGDALPATAAAAVGGSVAATSSDGGGSGRLDRSLAAFSGCGSGSSGRDADMVAKAAALDEALAASAAAHDVWVFPQHVADAVAAKLRETSSAPAQVQCACAGVALKNAARGTVQVVALEVVYALCKRGYSDAVREARLFDPVIQVLQRQDAPLDALTPAAAALRYASAGDTAIQTHLITLGALVAVTSVLPRLLHEFPRAAASPTVAYVATCARNFSVAFGHHVAKLGVATALFPAMLAAFGDAAHPDAASALARAIAKLAFDEPCAAQLCAAPGLAAAVMACAASHKSNRLVTSRLTLALGHLLHGDHASGAPLLSDAAASTDAVVRSANDLLTAIDPAPAGDSAHDDLLVNVARLLANLAVSDALGRGLLQGKTGTCRWLLQVLQPRDIDEAPEVTLHALMALCNITFYIDSDAAAADAADFEEELAAVVAGLLFSTNVEGVVEATRILSNYARTAHGRRWTAAHRLDEVVVVLLAHGDDRVVYNSLGTLLNVTAGGEALAARGEPHRCALVEAVAALQSETAVVEIRQLCDHLLCNLGSNPPS